MSNSGAADLVVRRSRPERVSLPSRVDAQVEEWATGHRGWTLSITVLVGFALLCLRRPSAMLTPGLFAEDGAIFMLQALADGWSAVLEPYNGYLHLVPRLVAGVGGLLPVDWTPYLYALGSAAVSTACVAPVLAQRMETPFGSYLRRAALFLLLLLLPRLTEVHLTVNSLLWWCAIALVLLSLGPDPRTRWGRGIEMAAVPVLALSGLGALVLWPLPLLRWARLRSRHSLLLVGLWWGAAAVQAAVYLFGTRDNGPVSIGSDLAEASLEKVFGSMLLSRPIVDERWATGAPTAVLVLLAAAGAAWLAVVLTGGRWENCVAIVWTAKMSLVAGFLALGPAAAALPDRYTVLPIAAVLIGLFVSRPPQTALRWTQAGLIAVVLVARPLDFIVPARPDTNWDASAKCLAEPEVDCTVPLNPEPWVVRVPAGAR